MANRHMKRSSTSLVIREMHANQNYNELPTSHMLEWLATRRQETTDAGENVLKREPLYINCWWECKLVQSLWKTLWSYLKKLKIDLPNDSANSFLDIYLQEIKMWFLTDMYTPVFIAALFTIVKIYKQSIYTSVVECLKKMLYIYTMIYYSAMEREDTMFLATTWMDLEYITLSEIS